MAIQPITAYAQDAESQDTVFSRSRPARADTWGGRQVFTRRGDSYTTIREASVFKAPRARRNTSRENTTPAQSTLTRQIRQNAEIYRNTGPRQIAEQTLFNSQSQSTNNLNNLANTFGSFFNTQNASARQSEASGTTAVQDFAALYLTAGTRLLNTGSLFSNTSVFAGTSSRATTVAPQIIYLDSIQSYLSGRLSGSILGSGLNLLA